MYKITFFAVYGGAGRNRCHTVLFYFTWPPRISRSSVVIAC